VDDVRRTLTPQLRLDRGPSRLLLIDLGAGRNRLGGSCLAQVYGCIGRETPDLDEPDRLQTFFDLLQTLNREGLVLAYHDRSDGGLFATVAEMAFAGHAGVALELDGLGSDVLGALFAEELGAVLQVRTEDLDDVLGLVAELGMDDLVHDLGEVVSEQRLTFRYGGEEIFGDTRVNLHRAWSETTWRMQSTRDNPECARQEYDALLDEADPGLSVKTTYDIDEDTAAPLIATGARPRVAVLREQGVNSHAEMAAAFHRAGFDAYDVHMTDILEGRVRLADYTGLVACGGFSYGDVLGAGEGWAKSILFNPRAREEFEAFFARGDSFSLGVCNGCQMMAALKDLIPGAGFWPRFVRNRSEQFEARLSLVEVARNPSLFLAGMAGSRMPIVVSHGEGRAEFASDEQAAACGAGDLVALRYVDSRGRVAERYPANPNGSPAGIAGLASEDGRATIMMPHPERIYRAVQHSWRPDGWDEDGPWMRLWRNARVWLG
jgi:phosphoribosylformylglycinamidine synthase